MSAVELTIQAAGQAATERRTGLTENNEDSELRFAPGDDDKWRPDNGIVHRLSDGSPAIAAWEDK